MFTRLFTTALFAGAIAGVLAAVLQLMFVQPVLLHAELYESGQLVHFGGEANSAHPDLPGFDVTRDGLSIIFTMIIYSAYALILVAAMDFAAQQGAKINARTGLLWGVAGFVIVHLAPAFSLPPSSRRCSGRCICTPDLVGMYGWCECGCAVVDRIWQKLDGMGPGCDLVACAPYYWCT